MIYLEKKNLLATNHLHQNVTFFEVDNFGLDFGMYEVNNNIVNSMKIDYVMKNVEYNKKNLNFKQSNFIELEINKIVKYKKVSDFLSNAVFIYNIYGKWKSIWKNERGRF